MRILLLAWWQLLGMMAILAGLLWCVGSGVLSPSLLAQYLAVVVFGIWTSPKTWTAVVVTVADLNTHIRDNLNYLKAAGDDSIVQTTTSVGTQNNFALTTGARILYCNNASLLTVTGFAAGTEGQRLLVVSMGAGQVDLTHQGGTSTAANRLINFATSGTTSLAAGSGVAEYEYDLTTARWRLVHHEQGAWITPTFAAGDFTGNGSMTWTVAAGDRTVYASRLAGRTMTVNYNIQTSTVGGTPNTALQVKIPGGFTGTASFALGYSVDNGGTAVPGYVQVSGTNIQHFKNITFGGNWTASTDLTGAQATITFEVT